LASSRGRCQKSGGRKMNRKLLTQGVHHDAAPVGHLHEPIDVLDRTVRPHMHFNRREAGGCFDNRAGDLRPDIGDFSLAGANRRQGLLMKQPPNEARKNSPIGPLSAPLSPAACHQPDDLMPLRTSTQSGAIDLHLSHPFPSCLSVAQ
jgi:hypothetical protein